MNPDTKRPRAKLKAMIGIPLAGFLAGAAVEPTWASALDVKFTEGAPTDRFSITNSSNCPLNDATLTIDLKPSRGALVLDVTGTGGGVGVFQPLRVIEGRTALVEAPRVKDGDRSIKLQVARLAPRQTIAFTLDLDDTVKSREITVSNTEIAGTVINLLTNEAQSRASFGETATTELALPDCP